MSVITLTEMVRVPMISPSLQRRMRRPAIDVMRTSFSQPPSGSFREGARKDPPKDAPEAAPHGAIDLAAALPDVAFLFAVLLFRPFGVCRPPVDGWR